MPAQTTIEFDLETAQAVIREAGYAGLRQVSCKQNMGRIVLCGSVPSFYMKQLAQTLVQRCFRKAIPVDNQLQVECTLSTELEIVGPGATGSTDSGRSV